MRKGQISVELLMTIGVIMLIFLFILMMVFEKNKETREMDRLLDKGVECRKFASILEYVYASSEGTEILLKTRKRIVTNTSFVQLVPENRSSQDYGHECKFQGYISYYNVTGSLRIKKTNGAVVIQNA